MLHSLGLGSGSSGSRCYSPRTCVTSVPSMLLRAALAHALGHSTLGGALQILPSMSWDGSASISSQHALGSGFCQPSQHALEGSTGPVLPARPGVALALSSQHDLGWQLQPVLPASSGNSGSPLPACPGEAPGIPSSRPLSTEGYAPSLSPPPAFQVKFLFLFKFFQWWRHSSYNG